ncbi:hypothetical protein FVEN_g790 [Fusarium venenatum]|uniref:Ecp2 effector protein domain-containing protein n=1 Tax=Fusarium venenatum TaxID=56646 RepID=A0A2L2U5F2_9HYPO|nr:uncharacterized protein FVRRES_10802 [Fusarium venenatum]KAG8361076.1 hypothetical protein FVEN_g790 [Fusarium venenatum]CEI70725.1 unnamed protein product [Fusarium venenatum]
MHFKLLSIMALAGFAAAAPSSPQAFKDLPDGPYKGVNNADGSSTVTNLETGQSFDFKAPAPAPAKRSIEKRFTDCWGYELDHSGVDEAVTSLKNWAGTGQDWSSQGTPSYFGYNARGVYVYYCINAPNSAGNIDVQDINYALGQMDAVCKRYEASYFRWEGSVEIIGNARSGTAVCRG